MKKKVCWKKSFGAGKTGGHEKKNQCESSGRDRQRRGNCGEREETYLPGKGGKIDKVRDGFCYFKVNE